MIRHLINFSIPSCSRWQTAVFVLFSIFVVGGASVGLAQTADLESQYRGLMVDQFGHEPDIQTVQQDAIRYAAAEPERAQSWLSRSRLAYMAPRRIQLRLDRDFRDNRSATMKDQLEVSGRTDLDDDALWQFLVEWDLSRLIFNPDSVRAAAQAMDLAELREDVLNAVTKIYFERRILRMELATKPPKDFSVFARKRLRVDELTADLDALTGGMFSQRTKKTSSSGAPKAK